MDFTYVDIRVYKRVVLHILDAGTAYPETKIVDDRSMRTTIKETENMWLNRHGAPNYLSTDVEMGATKKELLKPLL